MLETPKSLGLRTYLFTYRYDGAEWSMEIVAQSAREVKERIGALTLAQYDGELIVKVPALAGPLARLAVWLKNVRANG